MNDNQLYISIGVRGSAVPVANKVLVNWNEGKTATQTAKLLRKEVREMDCPKLKLRDLWWAVYLSVFDVRPVYLSPNAPLSIIEK
jgi:hypothetical protein